MKLKQLYNKETTFVNDIKAKLIEAIFSPSTFVSGLTHIRKQNKNIPKNDNINYREHKY